ncbi:hypothetical protein PENTCL1PPCAC_15828 [Pristionchus entomophagus]|uniref:G protein-coupled receptor n=1 Tax=Pristionchus entomophagus TaxID=358040 RepID=A0AAV5TH90_9BILA|nr:hypothetical protein PENTCL1PPCAC_15828 [Pristionchus entomophagus]
MAEEKCCCFKTLTATKLVLWLTILFGILHAVTPPILNVSPKTIIFLKVAMVAAVICAVLALIGIGKGAPKLVKPAIVLNVIVQAFLLLEIFYSIAAIFFPSLPLPEFVKDIKDHYQLRLHSVEDTVENILQHISLAILVINIVLYAISLRVLILLVKSFYEIKAKRYRPVPTTSVFRMPPHPLVVVKRNESNVKSPESGKSPINQDTAIEMSKLED